MVVAARRQWERKALEGLVEHLRDQNHASRITAWPEDDPADPLSVDARIVIDGQEWGADHQRIVYDPKHPAAEKAARKYLRPRLEELASRHRVGFNVGSYPPRWGRGDPLPTQAWDRIVAVAYEVGASGRRFEELGLSVWPMPPSRGVQFIVWAAENASLGGQYEKALREPLNKKLSGQLRRAKDLGFPVLLLLDQLPEPESEAWSMWTPEHGTLAQVLSKLLNSVPGVVYAVWLREATENFRKLDLS